MENAAVRLPRTRAAMRPSTAHDPYPAVFSIQPQACRPGAERDPSGLACGDTRASARCRARHFAAALVALFDTVSPCDIVYVQYSRDAPSVASGILPG